jgi:predicted nucleotidyltransferase
MTENFDAEAQSLAFVKVAALAALHIQAVNSAVESGNVDELKASVDFGNKVSETILAQIPEDVQMQVVLELLGSVLGA